jgi:parallel beta-helix repeat protein
MFNNNSSPTVTDCNFIGNTTLLPLAGDGGGGMFNSESSPTVTNCTFSGNWAEVGGGMSNINNSSPTVTDCNFSGNTTEGGGGGMFNGNGSSPTVTDCTFSGNSAAVGGGMVNHFNSSPTVTYCTFSGNTASNDDGGGMYNFNSSPTVINCIFSGNSADDVGGGMSNYSSNPTVINCTLSGNSAMNGGGGVYNFNNSFTATNCIFWGDEPDEIYNSSSTATVTYCDVQGDYGGTGNIDADPCFVDVAGGDLRLSSDSPCIDTGYNNAPNLPATDWDGHPRIIDGDCNDTAVVDMGAYEFNYAYMGDVDYNCNVDFFDFSIFGRAWMTEQGDPDWDWACDINDPPDYYIDWRDLVILCGNWLEGTEPEL